MPADQPEPAQRPDELPAKQARRDWRYWLGLASRYRGVMALVAVFLLGVVFTPKSFQTGQSIFLTWQTQRDILFEYSEFGILACGMTLVILTGGIDLSVGSVLGFIATLFALLVVAHGWAIFPAVIVCCIAGTAIGTFNGFLIARFRIQPFVATLAMMVAARGAAKLISGGIKVQPGAKPWYAMQGSPPEFYVWMTKPLPVIGLQPATLLFLLLVLVMLVVVKYTRFGRCLFAVGGNEEAARLSGIRVGGTKIWAYALCSLFAALAGVVHACRLQIGDPEAGATYELDAIAAVVIGGTSLMGGQGSMFFTFLGTLIIAFINKILSINNVEESFRLLAKGLIIIVAVLIQQKRRN